MNVGAGLAPALSAEDQSAEDKLYTDFIRSIFNKQIVSGQISNEVVTHIAAKFMKGVQEGYGKTFAGIAYDTPDYNMIANLRRNIYQFSAAKNYQQIRELNNATVDESGKVREWAEYKKESFKILGHYSRYEETEYNATIAGGQMAGKWVGFQEGAEDMPFLMYETARDARVRDDHRKLDRIVKRITDDFWKKYYPPNGWNCRCTATQLATRAHETADKDITYPDIPKLWQVNTAEQNVIFPEGSPYFIGIPKDIMRQALEAMPYEHRYEHVYTGKNGGKVYQHLDVDPNGTDYKIVTKIAMEKADKGDIVHILPEIKSPDDPRRKLALKGAKYGKNPDLRINGEYVEVKDPESYKKVITRIHEGATQADKVIINLRKPFNMSDKAAWTIFRDKKELKYFELREKGKYIRFSREDYIK